MTTVRSYTNAFQVVEQTEAINLIPNTWSLMEELALFGKEFVSQDTIAFEKTQGTLGMIGDQVRGSRQQANRDDVRQLHSYMVPYFAEIDYVTPADLRGIRAAGTDQAETEAAVVLRKLERMKRKFQYLSETSKLRSMIKGTIYAPNGTVSGNYYTDFGVTQKSVDFVLGTATTDPIAKCEEVFAHITDNLLSGDPLQGVVALASPEFFAKLISQAQVKDAFKYFQRSQDPLTQRLGGNGRYRTFNYGNINFIEYRGVDAAGARLIPVGECYFVPTGTTDVFTSYYAPANKLDSVNRPGAELFAWEYRDPKGEKIEIEAEVSMLHLVRKPQLVVKATSSN